VKTDNYVHIVHNVVVAEHSLLIAQVATSGSSPNGRGVVLAGQVGVAGHITVGDGVIVSGKSGVAKSIPPGQVVSGNPTMPHQTYLRSRMMLPRLPEMQQRLRALEERVRSLEALLEKGRNTAHGD
jgi:UDP-3-O-[3-hydroxymyristoyl] glucosamine N-acyltransferase